MTLVDIFSEWSQNIFCNIKLYKLGCWVSSGKTLANITTAKKGVGVGDAQDEHIISHVHSYG